MSAAAKRAYIPGGTALAADPPFRATGPAGSWRKFPNGSLQIGRRTHFVSQGLMRQILYDCQRRRFWDIYYVLQGTNPPVHIASAGGRPGLGAMGTAAAAAALDLTWGGF